MTRAGEPRSAAGEPLSRAGEPTTPAGERTTDIVQRDAWRELRAFTSARIALGRSGASLPTTEVLRLGVAHAQARDAVLRPFDRDTLRDVLVAHDFTVLEVDSAAGDRRTYLQRPDLGRRLASHSRSLLAGIDARGCDVLCVVGEGLSAPAVDRHALALLLELRARFEGAKLGSGPVVLARQARVALGDEIGEALRARVLVMLIGERPGLSSPDSLGAYLTWEPRVGRTDAERNCVSNIRPEGLTIAAAALEIERLVARAIRLGATGVAANDVEPSVDDRVGNVDSRP